MKKIQLKIDHQTIEAREGQTIFQAAQESGIPIPHMCYDPRLDPFTSCWLCGVEVKGFPRLVPSCTARAVEGMEIFTQSERVVNARKTCLALLLSDHYGDCIAPCQVACPDHIDIQGYLALIALGKYQEALELIREVNPLPLCVGRVCPRFCEKECRRNLVDEPVGINFLKRFASEHGYGGIDSAESLPEDTGHKVAIIGAGPAGLTAAHFLRLKGHQTTIFEANPRPGGMMRYGIPEYRLPKKEMDQEIELIFNMGAKIQYGVRFGKDLDIHTLQKQGFQAILVAIGAWAERKLGCEGEDLEGVASGIGLLYRIASGEDVWIGNRVSVIGGGNTAIDCARSCLRIGASEVHLIYRRSREEMPANEEEVHEAEVEGIQIHFLSAPVKVEGSHGKVSAIRCIRMKLGEPDASGRRRPVPVEGSEYEFQTDMVIAAIGQLMGDQTVLKDMGIELTRWGTVAVDETNKQSNLDGVFAAGDCVLGPATVIECIAEGRYAAASIDRYLKKDVSKLLEAKPYNHSKGDLQSIDKGPFEDYEKIPRAKMPALPKAKRLKGFDEVELGLSEETAKGEALRCLSCGCDAVFDCKLRAYATDSKLGPSDIMAGRYNLYTERDEHPFIFRDRNKCIRCGLCVRMCTEVEGASAYGFVSRGFHAIIDPPLDITLLKSSCDSCGLCLSTCPTGALEYRPRLPKPGPWYPQETESICTLCGIGCQIIAKTRAGHCLEVTPKLDGSINQGKLCWKGTFGWEMLHSPKRIRKPARRQGGKMTHLNWDDAISEAGRALKGLIRTHGPQTLAFLISPRLMIEEAFLLETFAKKLGSNEIYRPGIDSANPAICNIQHPTDYQALIESDLILCLGSQMVRDFPVASYMIKAAVKKGAGLAIIGPESPRLTDLAEIWIDCEKQDQNTILSLLSALASDSGLISKDKVHDKEIQSVATHDMKKLEQVVRKGDVRDLPQHLMKAQKTIVPVNQSMISHSALAWLREGIWKTSMRFLFLSPYGQDGSGNEYGQIGDLEKNIKNGTIKGIVAFGHWKGLERIKQEHPALLTVQSAVFKANNGYQPDFFLPASLPLESTGSFINAEGRILSISSALAPLCGIETWKLILELAGALDLSLSYANMEELHQGAIQSMKRSCNPEKAQALTADPSIGNTKKSLAKHEDPEWSLDEIDLYLKSDIGKLIF